jgi:hypothetical protein
MPPISVLPERSVSPLTLIQDSGAKLLVNDVSTPDSGPVELDLKVNYEEISGYAFLMFRGVPEEFNFTTGFRVKNSWVVSLRDLDGLQLVPPQDYVGQIELTVILVRGRDETVESRNMQVSFGTPAVTAGADDGQQGSSELLTSAVPSVALEETRETAPSITPQQQLGFQIPSELQVPRDQEQKLLERAASLVEIGEIASARLMFEHLARQGSGLGALAMAQTFDPFYFGAMKTLGGPSADIEQARMWYHIAAELGQEAANARLSDLSGN